MNPWGIGFRVCDRRYPFLWHWVGQPDGRWNRTGDQPVHYLASTPTVAWAEWIRHQEIQEPAVPSSTGQVARLALVDQLKQQGAQGLLAPTAAVQRSDAVSPCVRVIEGQPCPDLLPVPAHVILLWCNADRLPGWCCVQEGRPAADLLPLVRREGMLAP